MTHEFTPEELRPAAIVAEKLAQKAQAAGYENAHAMNDDDPNLGAVMLQYAINETANETGQNFEDVLVVVLPPAEGQAEHIDLSGQDELSKRLLLAEMYPEIGAPDNEIEKGLSVRNALEQGRKTD